ncbi:aminoacyl-tRNA deacylase [Thalassomonas actiniarum]|uniref:YbaK/EbsC family protein n=1 Tax=Thalassomonas actiniarum TaxID=485447 RepID=A0AAE9YK80_9GAMM|nr:YbaK/EbsC family protein [Thalassomonas actiniarum]WDD96886.1 YbaK/EbsC family protein [Thalassomonas actiniarum]
MAISNTLNDYLSSHDIHYELVQHRHTQSSLDSSCAAHLPGSQVAKAVILQSRDDKFLMATLAADHRLDITRVNELMDKEYHVVSEARLRDLFPDCAQGAIPGLGQAFAIDNLIDDGLLESEQVYLEAGDHHSLVKLEQQQYLAMVEHMPHGNICGEALGMPRQTAILRQEK